MWSRSGPRPPSAASTAPGPPGSAPQRCSTSCADHECSINRAPSARSRAATAAPIPPAARPRSPAPPDRPGAPLCPPHHLPTMASASHPRCSIAVGEISGSSGIVTRVNPAGEPANAESRGNWDGDGGTFWGRPRRPLRPGASPATRTRCWTGRPIAERDRVLDVGCGNGRSRAGRRPPRPRRFRVGRRPVGGHAGGRAAPGRRRGAGQHPVRAGRRSRCTRSRRTVSISALSRNGTMFFDDPAAAFGNLPRCATGRRPPVLRPGRRSSATSGSSARSPRWAPRHHRPASPVRPR